MNPGAAIKRFGAIRGLQVMGFCALWVKLGSPTLERLSAEVRAEMERQGLSTSAAYRYIRYLRAWNEELGRDPDDLDALARLVSGIPEEPEKTTQEPIAAVGKPVLG